MQWGKDCLGCFRGMFSIALWDGRLEKLLLVRDRFGVKPLYYTLSGTQVSFASELRGLSSGALHAGSVSSESAAAFLRFGYVSAPNSLFADVAVVPPGGIVSIDSTLRVTQETYWSPRTLVASDEVLELRREFAGLDEPRLLDRVEGLLAEAFNLRLVSDVPVGLFLSGGIDSSVVATVLARRCGLRLRTFTIGYADSSFNEIPYARALAAELATEHIELEVSDALALSVCEQLLETFDEPIGDSSTIPTFIVCRLARQSVTVALSADGADELFGGYPRYQVCASFAESLDGWMRFAYLAGGELLNVLPPSLIRALYYLARRGGPGYADIGDKIRKFVRMTRAGSTSAAYDAATSEWTEYDARALLASSRCASVGAAERASGQACADYRMEFMLTDLANYLVGDLLTKLDRASMAVSLEAREPFLDQRVAAIAFALPWDWKIRHGKGKYVLRQLLARHLSSDFFNRPKQGFSAPVGTWMRGVLRPRVEETLSDASVARTALLDARAVRETLHRFMRGSPGASAAGLWHVMQLQNWCTRWGASGLAPQS
jgi:asparagine synthase (glutamine-hydrolysing)